MRVLPVAFLFSFCGCDSATIKLGDDTGSSSTDTAADTASSTPSPYVASVAFDASAYSGTEWIRPGAENVGFGVFSISSEADTAMTLTAFLPTVYVADDVSASSGYHAGHQGNVWAQDHLASCRLIAWPDDGTTFGEAVPDADGILAFRGLSEMPALTGADSADTAMDAGVAQAFEVVCDFTAQDPQDGMAAFAVDVRDGTAVGMTDGSGMSVAVTVESMNGDPPQRDVSLEE